MTSLIKQLLPDEWKFTPATDMNWTRVQTLIHGPGASDVTNTVRGGDTNSAVFACLMAICTAYPEAPLRVFREQRDSKEQPLPEHPLQKLLNQPTPNGEFSLEELFFWTTWAKHTDGNAYWYKVRSGNEVTGNVVELWPISPHVIEPVTLKDTNEWIDHYRWQFRPNQFKNVPPGNIIHFRMGVDDRDQRLGLSPLKRLIRQVATDEEADKFTETLLKNYAIPGMVVIPPEGTTIQKGDADRIRDEMQRKFGNDKRGNIAVLSKIAGIEQFGFSPEQMNLSVLHRIPEERIAAVMGVPAIIAGLGAGLERSTYSNFREAREMFTEQKLVPMWRADSAKIDTSLKPDFTSDSSIFTKFDVTGVRALQEDEDRKYARLNIGVQGMRPWITVNEARTEVGLPTIEGGDELRRPQPPPLFGENGQRDEDEESGEEQMAAAGTGGANGQRYPFRTSWEGYP